MMNKGNLSYGLNARSGKGGTKKRKGGLSGFGDDNSDDSSDDIPGGGTNNNNARSSINKEIAAEQEALRKRAQSAMAKASSSLDTNVYDYDAEYDTFSSGKKLVATKQAKKLKQQQSTNEPKKSKYISSCTKNGRASE